MTSSRKTICLLIAAGSMLASSGRIVPAFAQQTALNNQASYISFQVPGYPTTLPVAINNSFTVAGQCVGAQPNIFVAHGFVRDVSGKITVFDPPGSVFTQVLSMNAAGTITGYYQARDAGPSGAGGFVRSPQGTITTLSFQGNYTNPSSINDAGTIAGYYVVGSGGVQGFVRTPDGTFTPFDVPGSTYTSPNSINNGGMITGSYGGSSGGAHGFVRATSGGFTSFDPEGSVQTSPGSIDAAGTITGQFTDASGGYHGFVRSPQGKITTFDAPGSTVTTPTSINAIGTVAGFFGSPTFGGGFVRTGQGAIMEIEYPGASSGTSVYGINDYGAVAGTYDVGNGTTGSTFGFMLVPASLCCSGKPVQLTVQAGGFFWDGGGSQYGTTALQEYLHYPSAGQNWSWTPVPSGFTVCTLGNVCLSDNGRQVALSAKADVLTITNTGAVLDMNSGQFIQNASAPHNGAYLSTGPTASSWNFSFDLH